MKVLYTKAELVEAMTALTPERVEALLAVPHTEVFECFPSRLMGAASNHQYDHQRRVGMLLNRLRLQGVRGVFLHPDEYMNLFHYEKLMARAVEMRLASL